MNIEKTHTFLPYNSGAISLNKSWFDYFINGEKVDIKNILSLPIEKMTTNLNWDDLILGDKLMKQTNEINTWIRHQNQLITESTFSDKSKSGYISLFYGLTGSEKSLTASLIAKTNNLEIYKVNTPLLIFKNPEETEKNLYKLFDTAAYNNWILYFDDTDILFDNYKEKSCIYSLNKQMLINYFFKQVEDYPGVAIFSLERNLIKGTKLADIFQSTINFKIPNTENRINYWKIFFKQIINYLKK